MIFVVEATYLRRCGRSAQRTRPVRPSTRIAERAVSDGTNRLRGLGAVTTSGRGCALTRRGTVVVARRVVTGGGAATSACAPCERPTATPPAAAAAAASARIVSAAARRRRRRRPRCTGWSTGRLTRESVRSASDGTDLPPLEEPLGARRAPTIFIAQTRP